jgi:hypothetical protein
MKSCPVVELGRRRFLRGGATAAAATVASGVIPRYADATPALARISYPGAKLVNLRDLNRRPRADPISGQGLARSDHQAGRKVEGGVGPDGDIVAFAAFLTLCVIFGGLGPLVTLLFFAVRRFAGRLSVSGERGSFDASSSRNCNKIIIKRNQCTVKTVVTLSGRPPSPMMEQTRDRFSYRNFGDGRCRCDRL